MARKRLRTLADVRRYLANKMNAFDSGEITAPEARLAGYLSSALAGIIRDSDIEARIEALEEENQKNERN